MARFEYEPPFSRSPEQEPVPHIEVLVIEDDEKISRVIEGALELFENAGSYTANFYTTAEDAIHDLQVRQETGLRLPHLVLTDNHLAGEQTGFDIAAYIKAQGITSHIVMITASAQEIKETLTSEQLQKEFGIRRVIGKPFDIEEIPLVMQTVRKELVHAKKALQEKGIDGV